MGKSSDTRNPGSADSSLAMRIPMIVGCLSWSAPPIAYGIDIIARQQAYWAEHPLGPNQGRCGMGMMLAFALIFCVAPVCGTVGVVVGRIIRSFYSD